MTTHDVSELSILQKRLNRAALATKVIGVVSAFYVFNFCAFLFTNEDDGTGTGGILDVRYSLGLALGILLFWCAVRLSKRLRSGDKSAVKIVAVWVGITILYVVFSAIPTFFTFFFVSALSAGIGLVITAVINLPIYLSAYFIVRGLRALRAYEPRLQDHSRVSQDLISDTETRRTKMSRDTSTTHDVSEVSVLRKRLGRAAFSMKVIGLLTAFTTLVYASDQLSFLLALALSILLFWCAVRLSKRLRSGDSSAAKIIVFWLILWVAFDLFDALPKSLNNPDFNLFSLIGMAIFNLPIYFLVRGLLALRTYKRRLEGDSREAEPLRLNPWEESDQKMKKHPAFVNKRSLSLYPVLLLVPLPWIFMKLSSLFQDGPSNPSDVAEVLGYQIGQIVFGIAMWLFLTAYLYRRARRNALLPATELSKKNPRTIVLYLRSFLDDKIKMRARAANGRSWLERAVKVTFEEVITDHLWRYGPVVAIGKPGDKFPPLGASRDYVPDESWQQKVEKLMTQASIVVLVVGRTEGLAWELGKLVELGLTRKLILLLPPAQLPGELRGRWDNLCDRMSEIYGMSLPRNIDLDRTRAVVFPMGEDVHIITADKWDDWTYEAVLDAVAELIRPADQGSENAAATRPEQRNIGAERYPTHPLPLGEGEVSSSG